MSSPDRAVVLLSGGLDSATTLALAKAAGFDSHALSFRYGQRHALEVEAAARIAQYLCATKHLIVDIDLRLIGGSALTGTLEIPKDRSEDEIGEGIPITYVPGRNTIFLSFALAWAEVLQARDIFIGVNALDYSGYPDCRPEYIEAFQKMANLATKAGVNRGQRMKIHAPLIGLTKAQIIKKATELRVDYSLTLSCYDPTPDGVSCARCDSCLLRRRGFADAGMVDPIPYAESTVAS